MASPVALAIRTAQAAERQAAALEAIDARLAAIEAAQAEILALVQPKPPEAKAVAARAK